MEENKVKHPKKAKTQRQQKRIIEITASVSAVIPTGNYENFKPMYSVKEIVKVNGNSDEVISNRTNELRELLLAKLNEDYERMRIERIKLQRQDIKFYQRGNKQYPSVTSIINAIEPITYDPDKLKQYASRGNIIHAQIAYFFKTGRWEENIDKIPNTKLDKLIVTQGSLKLKWDDVSFMNFWEKFSKDIEVISSESEVYNDEYLYAGTLDLLCKYKGKLTVLDFKTANEYDNAKLDKYFRQTSAYAKCLNEKVEQMVIVPLKNTVKQGYGEPFIEEDIDGYFMKFLQDRSAFKEIYGI